MPDVSAVPLVVLGVVVALLVVALVIALFQRDLRRVRALDRQEAVEATADRAAAEREAVEAGRATDWLGYARELQAMAAIGGTYARDPYDAERYRRLDEIAVAMTADLGGVAPARIADLHLPDTGYVTPKVDVRAVVTDEHGRLLLVRERSDDGWALPGGWADVTDSPAGVAVRETAEEAGYQVSADGLVGVYDRQAPHWRHPPEPYAVYKIVVRCRLHGPAGPAGPAAGGDEVAAGAGGSTGEVSDAGWFAPDALPPLSLHRNSAELMARIAERLRDPDGPADLD